MILERPIARIQWERDQLTQLLGSTDGEVMSSQGNFVFYRGPLAVWIAEALASIGIAIRSWPGDERLGDAIRITCPGHSASYDRLVSAIKAAISPGGFVDIDGVIAEVSEAIGLRSLPPPHMVSK